MGAWGKATRASSPAFTLRRGQRVRRNGVGIFDFLKKGSSPPAGVSDKSGAGGAPVDKKIASLAKVAGDKRAQNYDRIEAIQALAEMKSPEAAAGLLKRFTFSIDPSITDQEEKDLAFAGVVAAGKDVVPAVIEFCVKADALTLPLKVLRELLPDEEYQDELINLLERFDTEYARNVEPKIQLIVALEDTVSDDVRVAVERFLDDVNETVRFHAVKTVFAQHSQESVGPLVKMLEAEESVRIKNKVAEGMMQYGFTIPPELREKTAAALRDSSGFTVNAEGKVVKGARGYSDFA
jgi:HEAT repeat protein